MGCKRRSHATLYCHIAGVALAIGLACFMTKSKKGRRFVKKAKRIAGEVEDLVRDEFAG